MSKFDSAIDEYAYTLSLDGCDDEAGSVSENGVWYGLLRGVGEPAATARLDLGLSAEDCQLARTCAGAIVSENDQGFVTVEWYGQEALLDEHWGAIVADLDETDRAAN